MRHVTIVLLLLSFVNLASNASAAIATSNIDSVPHPDGQNITTDSLTGLDWLDPTATLNYSFNEITARFANDLAGFRYATRDDIVLFLSHISPSLPTDAAFGGAYALGDPAPYDTAVSYLGDTYEEYGERGVFAITSDISTGGAHFIYQLYRGPDDDPYYGYGTYGSYSINDDGTTLYGLSLGSWLVRDTVSPVPEPAAIVIWGVGCCGVVVARLRRRAAVPRGC